jgi:hypothetical protein
MSTKNFDLAQILADVTSINLEALVASKKAKEEAEKVASKEAKKAREEAAAWAAAKAEEKAKEEAEKRADLARLNREEAARKEAAKKEAMKARARLEHSSYRLGLLEGRVALLSQIQENLGRKLQGMLEGTAAQLAAKAEEFQAAREDLMEATKRLQEEKDLVEDQRISFGEVLPLPRHQEAGRRAARVEGGGALKEIQEEAFFAAIEAKKEAKVAQAIEASEELEGLLAQLSSRPRRSITRALSRGDISPAKAVEEAKAAIEAAKRVHQFEKVEVVTTKVGRASTLRDQDAAIRMAAKGKKLSKEEGKSSNPKKIAKLRRKAAQKK